MRHYNSYTIGANHMASNTAIVYTGHSCSWCARVKVLLKAHNYTIEEKLINKSAVAQFQYDFKQPLQSIPQVIINNKLIGGFAETEAYLKGPLSINKV